MKKIEEAALKFSNDYALKQEKRRLRLCSFDLNAAFQKGGEWRENNAWKDAQGDDLPLIDREVIALVSYGTSYKVVYAHRPDPKPRLTKDIDTGGQHWLAAKTYDKGGWNMPDVAYWLDIKLPFEK